MREREGGREGERERGIERDREGERGRERDSEVKSAQSKPNPLPYDFPKLCHARV